MAEKQLNLNVESETEKLDLSLCLGVDKGKKPIDESLKPHKRKTTHKELEGDEGTYRSLDDESLKSHKRKRTHKELEGDEGADRSLEDRLRILEHKLKKLEELVNHHAVTIKTKIDEHFYYFSRYMHDQNARSIECMNRVSTNLCQIILSLGSRNVTTTSARGSSSKNPKPPKS